MSSLQGLRAGAAQADITPDWPIELAGFAGRLGPAKSSRHPITLRALVVEHSGERALILSADLLNWGPEQVAELGPIIAERAGVGQAAIMFSATHSHSGPQPNLWHSRLTGVADERYLRFVAKAAVQVAVAAADRLQPVTAFRSSARYDLAMYRRVVENGQVISRPNPDGPTDHELTVLALRRPDGSLLSGLVHYACHPVLSNEIVLSGEFTGEAMRLLGERHGAVVLYLQGCAGDQNPSDLATAGLDEIDVQAGRLADAVHDVLTRPMRELPGASIRVCRRSVELPFMAVPSEAEIAAACLEGDVVGDWGRALRAHPERIAPSARLELQRLDLADGFGLLGMNAEVTIAYGLDIKARSGGTLLPVGYANGMIGYLPTEHQIHEGGYEADHSCRYYFLPGRFAPRVEAIVRAETRTMVEAS